MLIPDKIKRRIRQKEPDLFYSNKYNLNQKRNIVFKLLYPLTKWMNEDLNKYITKEEIYSEKYILICKILQNYNKEKSSFIPYIEKALIWEFTKLKYKIIKYNKIETVENITDCCYYINENYYLYDNILLENKYLKNFTYTDRYYLHIILQLDKPYVRHISNKLRITEKTVKKYLKTLKNKTGELL